MARGYSRTQGYIQESRKKTKLGKKYTYDRSATCLGSQGWERVREVQGKEEEEGRERKKEQRGASL